MFNVRALVNLIMGTATSWQGKRYKQCNPNFVKSQTNLAAMNTNMCTGGKKTQVEGNIQKYKQ